MGCCNSGPRLPSEEVLLGKIRYSIESNNAERLSSYSIIHENIANCSVTLFSDMPIIKIKSISLSCLGYSLWLGHQKVFRFLYEKNCSGVVAMEEHFNSQNTSGIDILMQRKYSEFLSYYLPIYLSNYSKIKKTQKSPFTIHNVIESANITLLSVIVEGLKDKAEIPKELDVHAINEETGDNGALVACRACNLTILKYLIQHFKLNFRQKNKEGKGVINVIIESKADKATKLCCLEMVLNVEKIEIPDSYPEFDEDFQKILHKLKVVE